MANKISKFVCMFALSVICMLTFLVSYNSRKDLLTNNDGDLIQETTTETKTADDYSAQPELIKIDNVWYYITSRTYRTTTTETTTATRRTTTYTTTTQKPMPIPAPITTASHRSTQAVSTTTTSRVTTTTTSTTQKPVARVYTVYKPSTHYIHMSTCKWFDKTCIEITDTHGLECRRCSQCKPDMTIEKEYVPPVKKTETVSYSGVSQSDIILLQKLVANEYGADWVSTYEKAKIVAAVMNQVKDKRFPNTVRECIYKSCVPYGFNPNKKRTISQSVKDAVAYYFNHPEKFKGFTANSWYGDGKKNHFYTV